MSKPAYAASETREIAGGTLKLRGSHYSPETSGFPDLDTKGVS